MRLARRLDVCFWREAVIPGRLVLTVEVGVQLVGRRELRISRIGILGI